ncbi:Multisite-specific tRNA:(cytosine-C(5))-methyltransferase [Sphaceloma murrayae]|uniref:Multisite-specific tRNA:(Cytosine-C(5))-methyltransferase n=1 Tax=Sphaceloma murrayae TaxID=2082308 RepID=A0A2K1QID3_9PEZI|nr:Multisite-specific tRNA:(cytosine-C(5))-methyltransferase [Sphaceloma murrayae]
MPRQKYRGGAKGRGNSSRGGRGGKRGGHGGSGGPRAPRQSFQEVNKTNEKFERFYNELDIVPEGEEREQFWEALRRELPNSFRFCGSKGHALAVQKNLTERYIPTITSVKFNGENVAAPEPLPWYPAGLAWQMTTPKQVVRKFPPFAAFQKFLVSETSVGNISRQEAVSMIPPLVLDVQSQHTVLDLCAAPGSKSAQLIEALHAGEEARMRQTLLKSREGQGNGAKSPAAINSADEEIEGEDWGDDGRSTGLLVANDMNYQRAQMLVHQVKRLNSPNLVVMNHDATLFPSIQLPSEPIEGSDKMRTKWLKFDRILADVPCSGDGTCRKNPNIWKDWIPGNALGLYITQVRILVRSLQMLKVGGRVVYSTCSMNPVENEAVISSAIDRCGGVEKVEIIDCSDRLSGLKRYPGLTDWKVIDKGGKIWNKWEDVEDAKAKQFEANLERLVPGMFPSSSGIPIERCMRVYPHQQDTGGFFITVLEKKSEIRAKPESAAKQSTTPSVVSIAKEIEAKKDESGPVPMQSVNEYMEHNGEGTHGVTDQSNASAAQRSNKEVIERPLPPSNKRPAEEGDSESAQIKRAKVELEDQDTQVVGEVGQMEHYPPPPVNQQAYEDIGEVNAPAEDRPQRENRRRNNQPHEESFKYLKPDHPEIDNIFKFYGLPERFPRDRFMVRNEAGEPAKAIYYTTELAKKILTTNEGKGMKFVHSGIKMFVKQDVQGADTCRWRIQTEGLPLIEGWVDEERVVRIYKKSTLQFLLREMFPKTSAPELGEAKEQIHKMAMGCSICRIEPSDDDEDGFSERIVLPIWRSVASVNLMLPKEDRKAMLLRIYNDDTPLIDHSQQLKPKPRDDNERSEKSLNEAKDATGTNGVREETFDDEEDGGVKLDAAADETVETADATAPLGMKGVGTEESAMEAEDALRKEQEMLVDEAKDAEAAPEREGEEDRMNTTV